MDRPNPEPGAGADLVARCHPDKAVIRQLEGLCRTSEWPVIRQLSADALASTLLLAAISGPACVSNPKVVMAHAVFSARKVSDAALGRSLPGFEHGHANVNETRLH